jgi:Secretion system C-terminal sorting domain
MKHILLVPSFLLFNVLAFAQALQIRNSPNPQTESVAEPAQLANNAQTNDIQAMVRWNNPSHSFAEKRKGAIIVEEQVLFTRPDVLTGGTGIMKYPEMDDNLDEMSDTDLKISKGEITTVSQVPTNAQNTDLSREYREGLSFKIEMLNNTLANSQNAARNQDTDAYMRISPNPINDAAVVEIENAIHGTFQVFDMTGRLLNRGSFDGSQFILERKNLNKGVYILNVLEENRVVATKKIVVN